MKSILLILLLSIHVQAETRTFELGHGEFELTSASGDVTIQGISGSKLKIVVSKQKWSDACEVLYKREKNELHVDVEDNSSWFTSNECRANFMIEMPQRLEVDIRVGTGDLKVDSVTGEVDFKIGSGSAQITNTSAASIEGDIGSGSINLTGSSREVDFEVGSGKVNVTYSSLYSGSEFSGKTGAGDISLIIPKGKKIKTKFESGAGELKSNIKQDASADLDIDVATGTGDLSIHYAK